MALSGSTNFALTGTDLVNAALSKLGVGSEGETVSGETLALGLQALNAMVKTWQRTLGASWGLTEGSLTLVAGQNTYTMGGTAPDFATRPLAIMSVRRRDSSNRDVPLSPIGRGEYFDMPYKAGTGRPTMYYFDPQMTQAKLYLWPTPTGTPGTLVFTYTRALQDFDAGANDADLPQEWIEALVYNLAVRLAPDFGVMPRADVIAMADRLKAEMTAWSAPMTSTYFVADEGY